MEFEATFKHNESGKTHQRIIPGSDATDAFAYASKVCKDEYEIVSFERVGRSQLTEIEESLHDFSHSGLGIGGAGRHNLQAEAAEMIARHGMPRQTTQEMVRADCGHDVLSSLMMSTSSGTSCADCYDQMEDM